MNSYKNLSAEQNALIHFVRTHPFPSYDEMITNMEEDTRCISDQLRMDMLRYYDETSHCALKICYDNITNKDICKKMGESILEKNDFETLRAVYYVFNWFTPLSYSKDRAIFYYSIALKYHWDGVGEWKA